MPGQLHGVDPFWDFQFARPEKKQSAIDKNNTLKQQKAQN